MAGANKLLTAGGGGIILTPATSIASDVTVQIPSRVGNLAVDGPAFSAYRATGQGVSSATWTKVQCATEEFDTNGNYDNSTNYRFTPTVEGYYQVSGTIDSTGSASYTTGGVSIYKNGTMLKRGGASNVAINSSVSALVYLNGSTDYVELYGYITGTSTAFGGGQASTFFQAVMVRAA